MSSTIPPSLRSEFSQRPHSPHRFPSNRPSSAVDLTELPNTPPVQDHQHLAPSPPLSRVSSRSHDAPNHHYHPYTTSPGLEEDGVMCFGDMALLLKTIDFAAMKHSSQRRKDVDQTPYINHPIACANFLASTGITDIRVLQAAVLHDTVEDTNTTIPEIAEVFGIDVATIVEECTDNTALSGQERKAEQVRTAGSKSKEAQQVKLADKLHNLESIRRSPPDGWTARRVQNYFIWAKEVTDACAEAHPPLADRLERLYKTAYTKVNGKYYPCHPQICGPMTEDEKHRIDSRWTCLKPGEKPSPKPIFF
ncbi:hypothetical protein BD324DRAFT_639852 [Kockovaella imperatae]|uniref:Guanosine-3',5'-bis(diphosphate) 3'-pyrophosphohydrolase MESH1 n=1 Tax=Kockovaella imperatae TaxID=4999 RepID=A0A1Y1U7E9_9TREE|nr:hypothetical protein BD324DRAFT_639852 [Kockovaella imperatae]ORX33456.1 hypothetical protein BD324DRAFT_639852 [Kockovaella imperatae]